ncbi:MAG: HlyD family secretion protein [Defluviitaleaceae bacterium]|nr:HlyD family secretion protein [Defluviitaleaceae bacterium]
MKTVKIGAVAIAAIMLAACAAPQEVRPAAAQQLQEIPADTQPQRIDAPYAISVRGVVESVTSRDVYTTLGLRVLGVPVQEGDAVVAGQVLAVLDTADLELSIARQRAALELARSNSRQAVADTGRMLREATQNLADNTNAHILNAEAALTAAELSLESARRNLDDAARDYAGGINPLVANAQSALRSARIELDIRESSHGNLEILYSAGALSSEEMRLSNNALINARNAYDTARTNYESASTTQTRSLEQLTTAVQMAEAAHQHAADSLAAARTAAAQDIERLRSNAANAQIAANLEHMELAVAQLEHQLAEAAITAPISGTLTHAAVREGAIASGLLFTVADTDNLRIITGFREYDIADITLGAGVTITSDAGGAAYEGTIHRINPAATPSAPVTEFEAEVIVTSRDTSLRIGMTTRLTVN